MKRMILGMICAAAAILSGCPETSDTVVDTQSKGDSPMKLTSSAFENNAPIPRKYTGEGADCSPPLTWTNAPDGTKSFALICDDPDAPGGMWVHWVLFNLPADTTSLSENVPTDPALDNGAVQGTTDFGRAGYGGPMPPPGKAHHYYFKLYALDAELTLASDATKSDVVAAMKDHILAQAQLMGTYQR